MKKITYLMLILLFLSSCENKQQQAIIEIQATEKAFEKMIAEEGLAEAFSYFAADSAVKSFGDTLIIGKKGIKDFYKNQTNKNISLHWMPDYIYASESGDLAYTYGKYTYKMIDANGREIKSTGIFHTVWRKQKNGTWKFVWD
ncbi:MAG: nuclear transport factor 2 family protein [Bacteroidales bacterium]|nr:nuclear transport factor 2 family protein [Bacteroidales bacterium]